MTQAVTIFKLWHASVYFLLQAWYFLLQEKVMTQIISIYLHSPTIYTFTKFDCSSKYNEVIIMYLLFFAFTLFSIRLTLKKKDCKFIQKRKYERWQSSTSKDIYAFDIRISSIMEFFPINSVLIVWNLGEKKNRKNYFAIQNYFQRFVQRFGYF